MNQRRLNTKRRRNEVGKKPMKFQQIGNRDRFELSQSGPIASVKVGVITIVHNTIKLDCEMWVILTCLTFA